MAPAVPPPGAPPTAVEDSRRYAASEIAFRKRLAAVGRDPEAEPPSTVPQARALTPYELAVRHVVEAAFQAESSDVHINPDAGTMSWAVTFRLADMDRLRGGDVGLKWDLGHEGMILWLPPAQK